MAFMNCGYCDKALAKSAHKGGRKREFCNDACKNKHYRWYKQVKRDADMIEEPMWQAKYGELYTYCLQLGEKMKKSVQRLGESQKDIDSLTASRDFWRQRYKDLRVDYAARMKALGISEDAIKEFNEYWSNQGSIPLYRESIDGDTNV
jgi:hypothetical protein